MRNAITLLALVALVPAAESGELPPADFGDAPEGVACYADGTIGRFPSCLETTPAATMSAPCPAPGTLPGPTGHVRHVHPPGFAFWLGCGVPGLDLETDARAGLAAGPPCGAVTPDCVATPAEWGGPAGGFHQDECSGDDVDAMAGAGAPAVFPANPGLLSSVAIPVHNAGASAPAFLNVLVDMNADGDWNDVVAEFSPCVPEWAVKNHPVTLPAGCTTLASPPFQVTQSSYPSYFVPTWVRITLSGEPVDDDFPWNGSAGRPDGALAGGETEDYPAVILFADPVTPTSWGRVKTIYR